MNKQDDPVNVMSPEELQNCLQNGIWLCPIESCRKQLSRKQTLTTHLWSIHSIRAGNPVKRYKQYDYDDGESQPNIPKTTKWRMSKKSREMGETPVYETFDQASAASLNEMEDYISLQEENSQDITSVNSPTSNSQNNSNTIQEILQFDCFETEDMDIDHVDSNSENEANSENEFEDYVCNSFSENEDCVEEETADSVPLYVLPPNGTLYSSNISHKEHLLSLCAYSTKNHLSGIAFSQLMRLINIHLPEKNLCETNVNQVKRKLGFATGFIKYYDSCDICGALFPDEKEIDHCGTPNCKGLRYKDETKGHGKHFFVTGDLNLQLREIVENENNWEMILTSLRRGNVNDGIHDIVDGKKYKEMKKICKDLTVTLTMFTDGVSLFKSSKVSLWPVYLVINELPPVLKFLRKNMILWGLWQGQGKPKMNTFFFPFVKELLTLYNKGLNINVMSGEKTIYVLVTTITMDLQARACMFNMTQHNGIAACIFCEEPGLVVKSGKGHTRCFPYRSGEEKPKFRTKDSIEQNVLEAVEKKKTSLWIHWKIYFEASSFYQFPRKLYCRLHARIFTWNCQKIIDSLDFWIKLSRTVFHRTQDQRH